MPRNTLNGLYALRLWNNGNYSHLDAGAILMRLEDHVHDTAYKILTEHDIEKLKSTDEDTIDRMRDKYSNL